MKRLAPFTSLLHKSFAMGFELARAIAVSTEDVLREVQYLSGDGTNHELVEEVRAAMLLFRKQACEFFILVRLPFHIRITKPLMHETLSPVITTDVGVAIS